MARILEGTPHEVADLTKTPSNDLDYYAYELARLRDAAREIVKVFDSPPDVTAVLEQFDAAVPKLRDVRNPLTHASDDSRLDGVGWFSALVLLRPGGDVEYLVDPRDEHHEAAESLAAALLDFLRSGLLEGPATRLTKAGARRHAFRRGSVRSTPPLDLSS